MAKRGLPGQLNLFDFWEDTNSEDSIVEMVSLIPAETEASFGEDGQPPVMHKEAKDKDGRVLAEISYLNYNKVYIKNKEYRQGKLFEFENSKEAVDFYISEMTKLTGEEEWEQG